MKITIKKSDLLIIQLMLLFWALAVISFFVLDNIDFYLSLFIVVSVLLFFYRSYLNKESIFQNKYIYIIGFSLFMCGRFFAYLINPEIEIFIFDFGLVYDYKANQIEKIEVYSYVFLSLIFYMIGISIGENDISVIKKMKIAYLSNRIKCIIFFLSLLLFFYVLNSNLSIVIKSMKEGYLSLYGSQNENYTTSLTLIVNTLFISLLAILYPNRKENSYFYILLLLFVVMQLFTILSGGRGAFVSTILIVSWFFLRNRPITLKSLSLLVLSSILLILLVNFLLQFTTRSSESGSIYEIISNNLASQGFTLMVFDLSTKVDDYPILAIIKTILPGSQILFGYFFEDIKLYDTSFPHYLTFISAPDLYEQGYGYGWSLLSDFYVMSFSFIPLFLLFNFLFGVVLSKLDRKYNSNYYDGLSFVFVTQIFMINRASLSTLLAGIIIYTTFYFLIVKLKLK